MQQEATPGAWLASCCSHMKLQEVYLPGSHDSGTYRWTTPTKLPPAVETAAALLFNVVADLSRTQRLTISEQLAAGVRVLDLRLAVNPWLASQIKQHTASVAGRRLKALHLAASHRQLTGTKLAKSLVLSHSLPGAPLAEVLADIRRFLQEHPSEVLVLLVKQDEASVNAAGIHRMHTVNGAWPAAALLFKQHLSGVQLLTQQQVEQLTIAELAAHAPSNGSVLLYSDELHAHGLAAAVNSSQLQILESYSNGTRTDSMDVGELENKLRHWMSFWHSTGWRSSNPLDRHGQPFLLLASAEVTLGVTAILRMLWNKVWPFRHTKQQAPASQAGLLARLLPRHGSSATAGSSMAAVPLPALGYARTLYELGQQTNTQLMADLLNNNKVPKAFNVWLLDAVSPDIVSAIIRLSTHHLCKNSHGSMHHHFRTTTLPSVAKAPTKAPTHMSCAATFSDHAAPAAFGLPFKAPPCLVQATVVKGRVSSAPARHVY